MRKKIWNEHVKLVATLFNAVSIGIVGVAVIGPLAQPDNPFYGFGPADSDKLALFNDSLTGIAWYTVVEWWAIGAALCVHALAHLITRLQVDD